jgi:hypothetical protein
MNRLLYYYLRLPFSLLIVLTSLNVGISSLSLLFSSRGMTVTALSTLVSSLIWAFIWLCWHSKLVKRAQQLYLETLNHDSEDYAKLPPYYVAMNAFWLSDEESLKRLKTQMDNMK